MPCFATLEHPLAPERSDTCAVVEVLGRGGRAEYALAYAELQRLVDRAGPHPSEAHVLVRNLAGEDDTPGNVVLNDGNELAPRNLPGGTRVRISAATETLFIGRLFRREEMGRAGAVELTFLDEKALLAGLPLRGALVWDENEANPAAAVKYVPALPFHLNPGGLGNCVECRLDGAAWPAPFFLPHPRETATLEAAPGQPTFWTPERALRYLWYLLTVHVFPAAYAEVPRLDPQRTAWPAASLQFASGVMQRKLPDLDLQGWAASAVLEKLCQLSGGYGWTLRYRDERSELAFFARAALVRDSNGAEDYAAEPAPTGLALPLQRAGNATDCKTAYDFHAQTDYSRAVTAVVVEGAPYEIEAEFACEDAPGDALEPAWTAAEADALKSVIQGDGTYARLGDALMDGAGGRPRVFACTREAVSLARENYPAVFRALRLKASSSALEQVLKGHGDSLAAYFAFALKTQRPILETQAQRMLTGEGGRTDLPYPVRIQVSLDGDSQEYHQVLANAGLRVTPDGLLWFDGLTDDLAGNDNLYAGSLILDPANVQLKKIKLNAVIRHDARLKAVVGLFESGGGSGALSRDPNEVRRELDEDLCRLGYGPQYYALDEEGFREQHQVVSRPTAASQVDGLPLPLNRILKTDQEQLQAHAERRLRAQARVARAQSWRLIGIRPEFRAGAFVEKVVFLGPDGPAGEQLINAPIQQVRLQFNGAQYTEIQMEGM